MVMTHGDDDGLVVPPRLAPVQVVIVPILRGDDITPILEKAEQVRLQLKAAGIRAKVDARDNLSPGAKYFEWERKGVPFRIEVGPKDIEQGQLALARRLVPVGEKRKMFLPEAQVLGELPARLEAFQTELMVAAQARRESNSIRGVSTVGELEEALASGSGFVYTGWNGTSAVEETVKARTKATIRVLPSEEFRSDKAPTKCVTGEGASVAEVVWARAY